MVVNFVFLPMHSFHSHVHNLNVPKIAFAYFPQKIRPLKKAVPLIIITAMAIKVVHGDLHNFFKLIFSVEQSKSNEIGNCIWMRPRCNKCYITSAKNYVTIQLFCITNYPIWLNNHDERRIKKTSKDQTYFGIRLQAK